MSSEEFDEALERIASGDPLMSNGLLDDGVLITGMPTGLAREGLSSNSDDEVNSNAGDESNGSARNIFGLAKAFNAYDAMVKFQLVNSLQDKSGSSKRPPILTPKIMMQQYERALENDPNYSGKTKLRQLERLHRVHLLYENGKLLDSWAVLFWDDLGFAVVIDLYAD